MNQWYYGSDGQQIGPIADLDFRQRIAQGMIPPHTLVWREGMAEWQPLSQVGELMAPSMGGMPVHPSMIPGYMPTNGLAIASMVCGIVSMLAILCSVTGVASIPAVICGHLALKKIRESELPMPGRSMAIAGLITGYLAMVMILGMIIVVAIMMKQMP